MSGFIDFWEDDESDGSDSGSELNIDPSRPVEIIGESKESKFDIQGIDWQNSALDRRRFRHIRLGNYKDIGQQSNLKLNEDPNDYNIAECEFYRFRYSRLDERPSIQHAQLRNLVAAGSKNDVYYYSFSDDASGSGNGSGGGVIKHWSPISRQSRVLFNPSKQPLSSSVFRATCITAGGELVAACSCFGEFVLIGPNGSECRQLSSSDSDNPMLNHAQIGNGSECWIAANDGRILQCDSRTASEPHQPFKFDWAINSLALDFESKLIAFIGDGPEAQVYDLRTNKIVFDMLENRGGGFACCWSPDGKYLVTASQDSSTRVYDVRSSTVKPLHFITSRMAIVRNANFSPDGQLLMLQESADYVRLFDIGQPQQRQQTIELVGELGGCCFTPGDGLSLFIGVADEVHGCLLEYERM